MFKEKLRELFYEVPEIKSDLEELRFGCKIKYKEEWDNEILTFCSIYDDTGGTYTASYLNPSKEITYEINNLNKLIMNELEIIGNPLEERHLRMYCENIGIETLFRNKSIELINGVTGISSHFIKIDNSKTFDNQSEEVYEKIFNYLK